MDEEEELIVRDSHGAMLKEGDSVTVIKDLKVRASVSVPKKNRQFRIEEKTTEIS